MNRSEFRTIGLTIDGEYREFEVHFCIESFGSSDTYWEPGDSPEVTIEEVFECGTYIGPYEVRVTDWAETKFYRWNVTSARVPTYSPQSALRTALFGNMVKRSYAPGADGPGNYYFSPTVETFRVDPQTVMQALEAEILENILDYQDEEPDYDCGPYYGVA